MQERFTKRRLPHWDQPGAAYFITTCLLGSIPAQGLIEIEGVRRHLRRTPRQKDAPPEDWKTQQWKQLFAANEEWLDCKPAVRHLGDERLAVTVVESLKHFDGQRYDLIAWAVMPSHLHWVFRPRAEWVGNLGGIGKDRSPRQRIQHSINLHTARECNRLLGRTGGFWQSESYDHCVRDEDELERIVEYIHANPVRAGLVERTVDFGFSSAREHALQEGRSV